VSYFEALTLLIALLAAVIAFVPLVRTTRLQERMAKADEVQAQLATRQLTVLDEEAKQASKADVRVRFAPSGNFHLFIIKNHGPATATKVNMSVAPVRGKMSPIPESEVSSKLPIAALQAGDERSLVAAITAGTGTLFDVTLTWVHADGAAGVHRDRVSI